MAGHPSFVHARRALEQSLWSMWSQFGHFRARGVPFLWYLHPSVEPPVGIGIYGEPGSFYA